MNTYQLLSTAVLVILTLSACTTLPAPATPSPNMLARERIANELVASGDLAGALVQWKILSTINPDNQGYAAAINQLNQQIKLLAEKHISFANAALQQANDETAARELLKALTLDPTNTTALASLREIQRREMLLGLQNKQNGKMYQDAQDLVPTTRNGKSQKLSPQNNNTSKKKNRSPIRPRTEAPISNITTTND